MKTRAILGAVALFGLAATPAPAQPQFQNYAAPGNLESPHTLGCIALDDAKPVYNPVDLYGAVRACIMAQRYDDAVPLFFLANVFGRYDRLRVSDTTAHQAITVARMQVFGDLPQTATQAFETKSKAFAGDKARQTASCVQYRKIGHPIYHPRYMIQHGMGAILHNSGDGLVPDFAPDAAWDSVLNDYMHCPKT